MRLMHAVCISKAHWENLPFTLILFSGQLALVGEVKPPRENRIMNFETQINICPSKKSESWPQHLAFPRKKYVLSRCLARPLTVRGGWWCSLSEHRFFRIVAHLRRKHPMSTDKAHRFVLCGGQGLRLIHSVFIIYIWLYIYYVCLPTAYFSVFLLRAKQG